MNISVWAGNEFNLRKICSDSSQVIVIAKNPIDWTIQTFPLLDTNDIVNILTEAAAHQANQVNQVNQTNQPSQKLPKSPKPPQVFNLTKEQVAKTLGIYKEDSKNVKSPLISKIKTKREIPE